MQSSHNEMDERLAGAFETMNSEEFKRMMLEKDKANHEQNREKNTEYHAEWRANQGGYSYENETANRRNKKKYGDIRTHGYINFDRIKAVFGDKCVYCGSYGELHRDHFVPLSKGGKHSAWNIVPACKSCNSSKGRQNPQGWVTRYFGEERYNEIVAILERYNPEQIELLIDEQPQPKGVEFQVTPIDAKQGRMF